MPPATNNSWSRMARVLWILAPLLLVAGAAAFILWPRKQVFYSDGERTWSARPDLGLRSVLWDEGARLEGLGDPRQDYDPCLSADGQDLYFTRGKAGGEADLYVAYRTLDGWTDPKPINALNTDRDEIGPALAPDGAHLYFYSNRAGGEGGYDLYVARHTADGWQTPENLGPAVNTPFNEYDPSVAPDGKHLLFASNRPAAEEEKPDEADWPATLREGRYQNDYDIYALDLSDPSATPRRLSDVCSGADDGQPTLSRDGRWLYFASNRPGGRGGYDIWRSRLTDTPLAGFMPPENLGRPVNTAAHELDPAVSLEGFGLYFSSDREARDTWAIYYARSHEVFRVVQTRRLAIGHILSRLSWPLIGLIAALTGLLLTLLALARLRRRPGLLAGAMMVSLILHLVALSLFTIWQISTRVSELAQDEARFEVAVSLPDLAESELSSRLRTALEELARTDTEKLAAEKSQEMTAPQPPAPEAPKVALAKAEPEAVPEPLEIARPQERPVDLSEPLRERPDPIITSEPPPSEPIRRVLPKPVRQETPTEAPAPRPVEATRREAVRPAPSRPPRPEPAPERRPDRPEPADLAEVAPPPEPAEAKPAVPAEALAIGPAVLPPEALPPEALPPAVRPPEVPRRTPTPEADADTEPAPHRTVRIDRADGPTAAATAPRVTAPTETPDLRVGPEAAGAEPMVGQAPEAAPAGPAPALEVPEVRRPEPTPSGAAEVVDFAPTTADAPVRPVHGPEEPTDRPASTRLLAADRAEAPVPEAGAPVRAPQAMAPAVRPSAVTAAIVEVSLPAEAGTPEVAPAPAVEIESAPAATPAAAPAVVDLAEPGVPPPPPVVRGPEAGPAAGPRETLAAARPPTEVPDHIPAAAVPGAPAGGAPARPGEESRLASAVPAGETPATPAIGEALAEAALPPDAAGMEDVAPPPAPLPPKEIYRLRTEPDRMEKIERLGGSPETEEAVRRALVWFARHQSPDGRWDVDGFMKNFDVNGRRADGAGNRGSQDVGVTALAALAFVGAGHTHVAARGADGPTEHAETVRKAIDWLIEGQKKDGDLRQSGQMYGHSLATMLLCESYSMTGDERLIEPIRKAVQFVLEAQNPGLGWRYAPRSSNDTSVLGWALMALKSAEIAGFTVPTKAYRGAANWLDRVRKGKHGGLFEYQPGRNLSPAMTAEGLFSEMLIAYDPAGPRTAESIAYLMDHPPRYVPQDKNRTDFYYWYYATLALHQLGGPEWETWNREIGKALVKSQRTDGPLAGSWDPRTRWGEYGGRVYTTAMAALTLEVYYRYLPFYDLGLGEARAGTSKSSEWR